MAAERLLAAGLAVDLYDRMPSVGRKLLMAGRGGLNLTHIEDIERFVPRYGEAAAHLKPMIEAFSPDALRAWADGLGQETFAGTSGRVFPKPLKASPLLRAWLARLTAAGLQIHTRHRWTGWDEHGALTFESPQWQSVSVVPDVTVLALGGASWPRLGSDGAWAQTLRDAGAALSPFAPANAGVTIAWSDIFRRRFEGEPIKRLTVTSDGQTETGEAVVTRTGLEGGAIYALNAAIRRQLAATGEAHILVDVRPSFSHEELATKLAAPRNKQSTSNFMRKAAGMAPVAIALTREGVGGPLPADPEALAHLIKAIPLRVTAMGGLDRAISTAGGVSFDTLDAHLMLRARPGVFAAGEMLDWEAPTGGYLLQATFATAVAAAQGAIDWLGRPR
jgi:uncharacterized flavoprotein (TIGR03862 family)